MTPTERERLEDSIENRTEKAKERLRLAQEVLTAFVDGLDLPTTARRVGRSRATVHRVRVWLGLETGRQWKGTGKRTGRFDTVAAIRGVQP
ncbi:MAG TPA: hypothetical protein VGE37_01480 [Archangium sp.]